MYILASSVDRIASVLPPGASIDLSGRDGRWRLLGDEITSGRDVILALCRENGLQIGRRDLVHGPEMVRIRHLALPESLPAAALHDHRQALQPGPGQVLLGPHRRDKQVPQLHQRDQP